VEGLIGPGHATDRALDEGVAWILEIRVAFAGLEDAEVELEREPVRGVA
jgi:hypothetical protein